MSAPLPLGVQTASRAVSTSRARPHRCAARGLPFRPAGAARRTRRPVRPPSAASTSAPPKRGFGPGWPGRSRFAGCSFRLPAQRGRSSSARARSFSPGQLLTRGLCRRCPLEFRVLGFGGRGVGPMLVASGLHFAIVLARRRAVSRSRSALLAVRTAWSRRLRKSSALRLAFVLLDLCDERVAPGWPP